MQKSLEIYDLWSIAGAGKGNILICKKKLLIKKHEMNAVFLDPLRTKSGKFFHFKNKNTKNALFDGDSPLDI